MMDTDNIVGWTLVLGAFPLLISSVITLRRTHGGIWLFSPVPTFSFAFLLAFVVRPFFSYRFGVYYGFTTPDIDDFKLAQAIGVAGCYAFALGYHSLPDVAPAVLRTVARAGPPLFAPQEIGAYQKTAFRLCLVLLLFYALSLARIGALTPDFGRNRQVYMVALNGAGYVFLLINAALMLVVIGTTFALWTGRLSLQGWVCHGLFLALNIAVSNRNMVTVSLYVVLFIYFLKRFKEHRPIKTRWIVSVLATIVLAGTVLGLARGIESANQPVMPLVFLAATFDMSEMLQSTIHNVREYDYGFSWLEDILYTYIPRAIFPDKPVIYGSVRLQGLVSPSLQPEDNLVNATYPIGAYGEGYANFGVPGAIGLLFLIGISARWIYSRCLCVLSDKNIQWHRFYYLLLYFLFYANALGYIRGFGQLLSAMVFNTILFGIIVLCVAVPCQTQRPAGNARPVA